MQMHCLSDSQKEYSARRKCKEIHKAGRDKQDWVKENNQNIFWTWLQFSSNKEINKKRDNNIILNNVITELSYKKSSQLGRRRTGWALISVPQSHYCYAIPCEPLVPAIEIKVTTMNQRFCASIFFFNYLEEEIQGHATKDIVYHLDFLCKIRINGHSSPKQILPFCFIEGKKSVYEVFCSNANPKLHLCL